MYTPAVHPILRYNEGLLYKKTVTLDANLTKILDSYLDYNVTFQHNQLTINMSERHIFRETCSFTMNVTSQIDNTYGVWQV
jgi:hypothetical protein